MFFSLTPIQLVARTIALSCAAVVASAAAIADDRPNIILCMGDDHGWDETGYNGHPHLKTPVLDEMAATGLRLDRFYSAHPTCSPTRGSVITGRHPNRYGTFTPNCSIRPEEISIAQILSKAGYACGHFGKWHLGPVKAESPTNPGAMGFDHWLSHDNFFEMNPSLSRNGGPPQVFEGEGSEIIIDETIRFIDTAKQSQQPFFAVVWFGSPHEPYSGLDKDLALYDELPTQYADEMVKLTSMETGLPVRRPLGEVLRERYAEITAMDRAIGTLRQHLQENALRQNTLLWYCGDNGIPSSGLKTAPLRGQKGLVYEGGVRVPGIIEWPQRIREPRVTDVNGVTTDMLPTLCEVTRQPLPSRLLDGVSLKPLIEGKMTQRSKSICFWSYKPSGKTQGEPKPYIDEKLQEGTTPLVKKMAGRATRNFRNFHHPSITEHDFGGPRAVLDNRYKFVVNGQSNLRQVKELFDIRDDPSEEHNLIESQPEIAEHLEQRLHSWQQSVLTSLSGADYADQADSPPSDDEDTAIHVPTPPDVVAKMLEIAQVKEDDLLYDLGCGDGRIVIAAAETYGCRAVGYDIDERKVRQSRENVRMQGVEKLVRIEHQDIFKLDLGKADVVTLYLLPEMNEQLIPQLEKLEDGSRIVAHEFAIEGVQHDAFVTIKSQADGVPRDIYLYTLPFSEQRDDPK